MATMQESRHQSAGITIPAGYLEDVRSAIVAGIDSDSGMLRATHADVLERSGAGPEEDRAAGVRHLREDMGLLDQVLDASVDTRVTGDRGALGHVLEATVRVLAGQLTDRCEYAPIEMGAVLELARRLRWAAEEAIRIVEPGLDERGAVA